MSFNITLYNCVNDSRYVTKTLTTKGAIALTNFREPYDTLDPTFIIQTDGINPVTILDANAQIYGEANFKSDLFNGVINYLSITDGSLIRYYYILKGTYFQNNLIEIPCHEDVLMTFGTKIKTCTGIIRRNENLYNLYIRDDKIKVYEKPIVRQKVFSKGFTNTSTNVSYMITTAGVKPELLANYVSWDIVIKGFNHTTAANGGEIVVLPNCAVEGQVVSGDIVKISGIGSNDYNTNDSFSGNWCIFNRALMYYNKDPQSQSDYYHSDEWCLGYITGLNDDGTIKLTAKKTFSFTTDTTLRLWFIKNPFGMEIASWSYGGEYVISIGGYETNLAINGTTATTNRHRSYEDPAYNYVTYDGTDNTMPTPVELKFWYN